MSESTTIPVLESPFRQAIEWLVSESVPDEISLDHARSSGELGSIEFKALQEWLDSVLKAGAADSWISSVSIIDVADVLIFNAAKDGSIYLPSRK